MIKVFCTKKANQLNDLPFETATYKVYGVEKSYKGQFREFADVDYIGGVIGAEIGSLKPNFIAMVAMGIAAKHYIDGRLKARGYVNDMSSFYQAFTVKHITPFRLKAAEEALRWQMIDANGNIVEGTEYSANSGGYTVKGIYPWIIAQYDEWTDRYNGMPYNIKNNPENAEKVNFGHRRGASQVGIVWAANHGIGIIDILEKYYPNTKVERINKVPLIFQGNYDGTNKPIAMTKYFCKADINNGEKDIFMKDKGCGVAVAVMAGAGLAGYEKGSELKLVQEACKMAMSNSFGKYDNGYKTNNGTNIKKFIPDYVATKGLYAYTANDFDEGINNVKAGGLFAISVNGLLTNGSGHIALVVEVRGDKLKIHNPNRIGFNNQNRLYTKKEILKVYKYGVIITRGENMSFTTLKVGSKGKRVEEVESMLVDLGYSLKGSTGKDYENDYYGTLTADIVKEFQKKVGLPQNGETDEATYKALRIAAGIDGKDEVDTSNNTLINLVDQAISDTQKVYANLLKIKEML